MNVVDELVLRCARKRRDKLGDLSDDGFAELVRAVRANPSSFVDDDEERAFAELSNALARIAASREGDDLLDDDEYRRERKRRLGKLESDCDRILAIDPSSIDARLLQALASDKDADEMLSVLLDLDEQVMAEQGPMPLPGKRDVWDDVFARPRLRLSAALSRSMLETARYRMARQECDALLAVSPSDELGARMTCALALARLEDEAGFDALDARFGRVGNAWSHLARALLMYKLDRLPAAKRALMGFNELCEGGAYVLLRPCYVDTYLPDRPRVRPGSFEEATLAVHEADPIVVDTPDFVTWASTQPGFSESARRFADEGGYDW